MFGIGLLSLLLLAVSGVMIDSSLRVARRRATEGVNDRDSRFYRNQFRRRMTANLMIGVGGVLIALWPIVEQSTPAMKIVYLALLLSAVMWMVMMAILDALAISRRYHRDRMEQIAEQARFTLEQQRKKLDGIREPAGDE